MCNLRSNTVPNGKTAKTEWFLISVWSERVIVERNGLSQERFPLKKKNVKNPVNFILSFVGVAKQKRTTLDHFCDGLTFLNARFRVQRNVFGGFFCLVCPGKHWVWIKAWPLQPILITLRHFNYYKRIKMHDVPIVYSRFHVIIGMFLRYKRNETLSLYQNKKNPPLITHQYSFSFRVRVVMFQVALRGKNNLTNMSRKGLSTVFCWEQQLVNVSPEQQRTHTSPKCIPSPRLCLLFI